MTITQQDLELYARRIRPHFAPHLRDVAEELALAIAHWAGPKTKLLRPETRLEEIWSWMGMPVVAALESPELDSLEAVEIVMSLEEELGGAFPEELLAKPAQTSFGELVQYLADRRR